MISHYQILVPKQLLDEFFLALHGHNANHPGIKKMIQEARQKYYYPCIAKYIRTWVTKCQMCIQNKRINNDLLKTVLLNCPEWDLGPEDTLQKDIFPNLPPSRCYDNIITHHSNRRVFTLFVCISSHKNYCPSRSKSYHGPLCKHTYLPTTIITDMGTQFNSKFTKEVAAVLNIDLKHATTKQLDS